jgi:Kef-type K+ transport system membrane component KefB
MTISTAGVAHILAALALVLLFAHLGGGLFAALRQPPVIGEILGGLVLGPTLIGLASPGFEQWLLPSAGSTSDVLNAIYQLGQLLLMFMVGAELRQVAQGRAERRTAGLVALFGISIPFAVGVGVMEFVDYRPLVGPHGSKATIVLVFAIAVAITSIPVISRIMLDIGILDTALARIVLTVAVIEDIALYLVLAVVLGIAQAHSADSFGISTLLGASIPVMTVYYVGVSVLFFGVIGIAGPKIFRLYADFRHNVIEMRYPVATRLLFLFAMVLCCAGLGINPIFGALMAGLAAARGDASSHDTAATGRALTAWESIKQFSLSFFIPIFFAVVGIKLDLVKQFDVGFFAWFLVLACAVKFASVWLASRLAGEEIKTANEIAIAMNARGGPGIVLATVTLAAGVINVQFYTAIVVLSIVTSEIAGLWLGRAFRRAAPAPEVSMAPAVGAAAEPGAS